MLAPKSILLVIDERSEQEAVLKVLQTANPDGRVDVVDSAKTALTRIAAESFDCVFSYLRSGPEDSVDFSTEVWNRTPNCARFVIAPSIDAETQIRCAFGAHHYLSSPLDPKVVHEALAEAEAKKAIVPSDRVQVLISRMRSLPSKPTIYFEVMREIRSQHPSATAIAALIEKDLGVASKLIQVVNSIFYGRGQAIHDIKEAVLFLGFEVTASVVLSLEAISRFDKNKPLHTSAEEVWTHSQPLAELSRKICQITGQNRASCDKGYLAGLLHDLGKLVLAQNFPQEYPNISRIAETEDRPLFEVEKEILGVSHADAGAYLLAVWGLPITIVEAVASHHSERGGFAADFSPAAAVHVAEEILESERPVEEIIQGYPSELGLLEHTEALSALVPKRANRRRENIAENRMAVSAA